MLFAGRGEHGLELLDVLRGGRERGLPYLPFRSQQFLLAGQRAALGIQPRLELAFESGAPGGQGRDELALLVGVVPLRQRNPFAGRAVRVGQPAAELGLQLRLFFFPVRGALFQPGGKFPHHLFFGGLFPFQLQQLRAESGFLFAYHLQELVMMRLLLLREIILYLLNTRLGGLELLVAHPLLFKEPRAFGLPGGLQRQHLRLVVGIGRAELLLEARFQHILEFAVILLRFALLGKVLRLQFGAAALQLVVLVAGGSFQRGDPGGKLGLLGAERGLQGGYARLVVGFQAGAEAVVFYLRLGQAARVLALGLEQARVPALYHGALVMVQLFEFLLVFVLQAPAQGVELGFLLEQLLNVELAFAQQGHGGFQLGVKVLFFLECFRAGVYGVPQGRLFELEAARGFLGQRQVLLEVALLFFDVVEPLQRPAQGHPGRVQAGHIVHQLLYLAIFVCHSLSSKTLYIKCNTPPHSSQ